jgi:predicted nucleic acid-binding protein
MNLQTLIIVPDRTWVCDASPVILLAGRRCAKDLGLSLTGTLGVVLLAKEDGLIDEVAPIVKALTDVGLRASDALVGCVLREAGETPV